MNKVTGNAIPWLAFLNCEGLRSIISGLECFLSICFLSRVFTARQGKKEKMTVARVNSWKSRESSARSQRIELTIGGETTQFSVHF